MSRRALPLVLVTALFWLAAPEAADGQSGTGVQVGATGLPDARAWGYRISGIGLPPEVGLRHPLQHRVRPPPLAPPRISPPDDSRTDSAGRAPPEGSGAPHRPSPRRSIVVVSGFPGAEARGVEVIRGGREPPRTEDAACVRVEVRLSAGTVRTARVALSRLGADDAGEAREVLARRMEASGVLRLASLDGATLSVPAGLVHELRVEPCREGVDP